MRVYIMMIKKLVLGMVLINLVLSPFISINSIESKIIITGAIFILGITFWILNILPAPVTGILLMVLFSIFEILTFEEAVSGLGNEIIWLVIAILIMGVAVEKVGLDKRISFSLLSLSKGNVKLTLFLLIKSAFILTFIIPNAVGRLAVLLPIGTGIIKSMEKQAGPNIGKSIMLSVTYAPYITTVALLTGASGSIYAAGLFESMLSYSWDYLDWMKLMIPLSIMVLIALWCILVFLFPIKVKDVQEGQQYFEKEKQLIGKISKDEIKMLSFYIILILLWLTRSYHHLTIAMSAVIIMVILFVPRIGLLEWKETVKKVNWGVPILFAAGFAIANAFENSGIVFFLSDIAITYLGDFSAFTLAFLLMVILIFIRIFFTNFNAMVASLMPVILTFAVSTPYNPLWLGMVCLVASSTAYFIPTQSIGGMMTFNLGYFNSVDMLKAGSLLTFFVVVLTLLLAVFYWPLVF